MLDYFKGFQIAKKFYQLCKGLELPEELQVQLLRASSSIALNLAEGYGKQTELDRKKYFTIALGSVRECDAIFSLEGIQDKALREPLDQLGAITYTLSRKPTKKPSSDLL